MRILYSVLMFGTRRKIVLAFAGSSGKISLPPKNPPSSYSVLLIKMREWTLLLDPKVVHLY